MGKKLSVQEYDILSLIIGLIGIAIFIGGKLELKARVGPSGINSHVRKNTGLSKQVILNKFYARLFGLVLTFLGGTIYYFLGSGI